MQIVDSEKHNRRMIIEDVPEYSKKYGPLEVVVNYMTEPYVTAPPLAPNGAKGLALDTHVMPMLKKAAAALDALRAWEEFWDNMPKGQLGKLALDVGLLNTAFLKMEDVLNGDKKKE